jgi:HD-GYP domain-containing protein (c-di-GMP phosphodiesterase class II)
LKLPLFPDQPPDPIESLEPLDGAEAAEIEELPPEMGEPILFKSAEYELWRSSSVTEKVPSLFLDGTLKILSANESFLALFDCRTTISGMYFTRFFSPCFDEKKSAELFRAVRGEKTGFSWSGRVERIGKGELLTISKVWVVPVMTMDQPTPRAYEAFFLDMSFEYRQLLHNTFSSLLGAARLKDNDMGNHIERVNQYARVLAEKLAGAENWTEVTRQFIASISEVAALHDLGKIGTPDDILNKAGPLESWEWDVMKQHTTNGAYILSTYPNPMAREVALRHHEKWNGSGYPHQLAGDLIPLPARIVAFADVYDALRMPRTYKEAYPHKRAVEAMRAEKGTRFDPVLMGVFIEAADEFDRIFSELADVP